VPDAAFAIRCNGAGERYRGVMIFCYGLAQMAIVRGLGPV
jgi:hypothetical protein